MKHPHYKKIVAKAANMDLVVFYRYKNDEWEEAASEMLVWDVKAEHFLCLPQHKEACLHWLNGGEVQFKRVDGAALNYSMVEFGDMSGEESREWRAGTIFLSSEHELRIKPKRGRRWILINKSLNRVCSEIYDYKPKSQNGWISHEIEIEFEV